MAATGGCRSRPGERSNTALGGNGGNADTAGAAGESNVDLCGDTFGLAAGGAAGTTTAGGAGGTLTVAAGSSCTAVSGATGTSGTGGNYGAGGGGGGGYYGGGGAIDQAWHETGAGRRAGLVSPGRIIAHLDIPASEGSGLRLDLCSAPSQRSLDGLRHIIWFH